MDGFVPDMRVDDAFERIEETILPCIAMMLESLADAAADGGAVNKAAFAAELSTLGCELDALTREIEGMSPARVGVARAA